VNNQQFNDVSAPAQKRTGPGDCSPRPVAESVFA